MIEDITVADAAFEASGATPEDLFRSACDALNQLMFPEFKTAAAGIRRLSEFNVRAGDPKVAIGDLLFSFLERVLYFKDAESLMVSPEKISFREAGDRYALSVEWKATQIDSRGAGLGVDIKAITQHEFRLERSEKGWSAQVVVDV